MPTRASRPCKEPGCPSPAGPRGGCLEHSEKPWASSTRRQHTKSGWQQQRDNKRILSRHGRICHWCGRGEADQVDHVVELAHGGTDTDDNKRPIHSKPCHQEKTAAAAARGRTKSKQTPHPNRVATDDQPTTSSQPIN